jgi:hypothetical protein
MNKIPSRKPTVSSIVRSKLASMEGSLQKKASVSELLRSILVRGGGGALVGSVSYPMFSAVGDTISGKPSASIDEIKDRALGGAALGGVVGTASAIGDHIQGNPKKEDKAEA